jgi:histidyl-tRNA synthetase
MSDSKFLSTQPYKGARDLYPEDLRVRNDMFSKWRSICERYGFEEYDFPILENLEVFASKSGEELVNTQIYSFEDRGGRKVAVRPELTPSTVRMIAARYNELPKPIKWFMIGNDWRFEKPQNGRGREFNQLEMNIFGVPGVEADFEIFSAMIDLLAQFGADETMFKINFNDRRLIAALLNDLLQLDSEKQISVRRVMDKRDKVEREVFIQMVVDVGLGEKEANIVEEFMSCKFENLEKVIPKEILINNKGFQNLVELSSLLSEFGLIKYCQFNPAIIRGFDYSDGLVYEVFSLNKEYKRSIFGGERFDKLINIYGDFDLAATGFAISDVSLLAFLEVWKLVPTPKQLTQVLVTRFSADKQMFSNSIEMARKLRETGINVDLYTTPDKLDKQFKYADKKKIQWVVVIGPDEVEKGLINIKNLATKEQKTVSFNEAIEIIKR